MATGKGSGTDDLTHLERLAQAPEEHHVFQALRLIEAAHPDRPRLGESRRPREDPVRLGQEAELAFPTSTMLFSMIGPISFASTDALKRHKNVKTTNSLPRNACSITLLL